MKRKLSVLVACALIMCGCTKIDKDAPAYTPPTTVQTESVPDTEAVEAVIFLDDEDDMTGGADSTTATDMKPAQTGTSEAVSAETGLLTAPEEYSTVSMVFAGDNLIHTPIYRAANSAAGGSGYNFMPSYEHLGTLISDADLAVLNQETIISDDFPPDTWPSFCTPTEMARDMRALGFDAFSISNNHVLDKGEAGLISTLNFWAENYPGVPVYGAYLNEDDMDNIRTLSVNGVTFAFLGYMEHTNGLYLPANSECKITYLSDEQLIEDQVKKAAQIADCVVVSVHFGIEVSNIITSQQYSMSQKLADWGADIIVGTQPHTIQSMEYLDRADGGRSFVFYCLGNFISCMDNPLSQAEILGRITVTKDNTTGEITLSEAGAVPLVNYYDSAYSYIGVYPLSEYTRELAATHAVTAANYDYLLKLFRDNIPEEFMSPQYREEIYG